MFPCQDQTIPACWAGLQRLQKAQPAQRLAHQSPLLRNQGFDCVKMPTNPTVHNDNKPRHNFFSIWAQIWGQGRTAGQHMLITLTNIAGLAVRICGDCWQRSGPGRAERLAGTAAAALDRIQANERPETCKVLREDVQPGLPQGA